MLSDNVEDDICVHSRARSFIKNEYSKSEVIYCRKCKEILEVLSTKKLKDFVPLYNNNIKMKDICKKCGKPNIKEEKEKIIDNKKLF